MLGRFLYLRLLNASASRGGGSRSPVSQPVADYFDMLTKELAGIPVNKADHNRKLQRLLNGRSTKSIEFKHPNISAVLLDLGCPFIAGYKPRSNYQWSLREVVESRLERDMDLRKLLAADADLSVTPPPIGDLLAIQHPPPAPTAATGHVAETRGDGDGFDILSFEEAGQERFIEVKTTKHGQYTPFFLTRNELRVSQSETERYHLYRLFAFRTEPRLYALQGNLADSCTLTPTTYLASVN
jgi:hypothetical protein